MTKRHIYLILFIAFAIFMTHRLTRQLHFFEVAPAYERPQPVIMPEGLTSIHAEECGVCHEDIYNEWKTTIHSRAWDEPYFQADFAWDGYQQICLNCHTPLENQQENLVLGFRWNDKFDPILKPNPNFNRKLMHEGVTCAVCHIKDGVIVGPYDIKTDAHPTRQDTRFIDGSGVCRRCHSVKAERWDVFLKLPPCGNFEEIEDTGERINCVKCHMPRVKRAMAIGAPERVGGRHLWRGGHDVDMVKSALKAVLVEVTTKSPKIRRFSLGVTNVGTEHRFPTGTPDRHLVISFRLYDKTGKLIDESVDYLQRIILWRPFIIDLWDGRIKYNETKIFEFDVSMDSVHKPDYLIAQVEYGLLREARRIRIAYDNNDPIKYLLYEERVNLK
ncbi:hypothetical protein MNBD_NITROSPINAE02-1922 [hydrothermal vent metagenome]|uniref:Cytochrome c-552/4 domain-containing protein n=1 Tax=hydrothermal vent metagenome TaxID=652676 RepID=A0A3B1C7Z7_9ZZZZ